MSAATPDATALGVQGWAPKNTVHIATGLDTRVRGYPGSDVSAASLAEATSTQSQHGTLAVWPNNRFAPSHSKNKYIKLSNYQTQPEKRAAKPAKAYIPHVIGVIDTGMTHSRHATLVAAHNGDNPCCSVAAAGSVNIAYRQIHQAQAKIGMKYIKDVCVGDTLYTCSLPAETEADRDDTDGHRSMVSGTDQNRFCENTSTLPFALATPVCQINEHAVDLDLGDPNQCVTALKDARTANYHIPRNKYLVPHGEHRNAVPFATVANVDVKNNSVYAILHPEWSRTTPLTTDLYCTPATALPCSYDETDCIAAAGKVSEALSDFVHCRATYTT